MTHRSLITAVLMIPFAWAAANGVGEPRMTTEQYIAQWKDVAIRQMQLHGIPASITLAQGILESGNGNSDLARKSNNHFGIKCHSDWNGKRVYHDDDRKQECFRKYKDASDSYYDHAIFLKKRRYEPLFALRPTDYKGWARGLKKAGYATDPKYPSKLIDLIERYKLDQYDRASGPSEPPLLDDENGPAVTNTSDSEVVDFGNGMLQGVHENGVKFVQVRAGDDLKEIAKQTGLRANMLARWNDITKSKKLSEGDVIFIQPKRKKVKGVEIHHVKTGESLWSVSQQYGLRLDKLCEYNQVAETTALTPGQQLRLRPVKRAKSALPFLK